MISESQLMSRIHQREAEGARRRWALWETGFRPFFLLAGISAVILVPWWVLGLMGKVPIGGSLGGAEWHAHEMLLGFVMCVVAGFLLTAVPKWTQTPAHAGATLKILAGLWLAGRLAMGASAWLPAAWVAAADLLFLPALAVAIGRPIIAAGSRRNLAFPGIIAVMAILNGAYHLQATGVVAAGAVTAMRMVVDLVVIMMVVIGGRVIPMFTRNGLARVGITFEPRPPRWIDPAAIALTAAVVPLEWLGALTPLAAVSLIAGSLVALRLVGWGGWKTGRVPLLWILHVGYAWVAVGLVLRGISLLAPGTIPPTAALHALTAGAMGSLILGMISRVSLGHTGRPLDPRPIVAASFVLVVASGLLRVIVPAAAPGLSLLSHQIAALLWAGAFGIFLAVYTPLLLAPRPDGAPG